MVVRFARLARVVLALLGILTIAQRPWLSLACLLFVYPQPLFELVIVPLGRPQVAYWATRVLLPATALSEPRGVAVLNELRARLRGNRGLEKSSWRMLSARLFTGKRDRMARAGTLAARAIVDVLESRGDDARKLFMIVKDMAACHSSRAGRAYAQAWLLADAAQRGAYGEVIRLSRGGPVTRRAIFMRCVARCMLGWPRPTDGQLWALWLCAPGRRRSLPLLRRALATPRRSLSAIEASGIRGAQNALLALAAVPRGAASRDEVRRAAVAVQLAIESGEIEAFVAARRGPLGATYDVRTVVARYRDEVVNQLAQHWRDAQLDAATDGDEPALVVAAKDQLQNELLDELESACARLPHAGASAPLDQEQRWRAWAGIRATARAYREALPDRTNQLYPCVGAPLMKHGAWLFNVAGAKILAHDIFRWLLLIATDAAQRKALKRNLRLGYFAS